MNAPLPVVHRSEVPATAADMRAHVNLVQEVMKAVMQEGTHYGKIPGTPKPSLWKPGAEVLCATFHIAPSYRIEDLSGPDHIRYRVVCIGTHQATSIVLGEGWGECSSDEEKYKWRKANSRKEFEVTPENRRSVKYGYNRDEKREYEIQRVRTEPADVANTVLKMACKRAQVAMTLNVTAASDIFTQDIEDLPEELRPDETDGGQQRDPVRQPQSKSGEAAGTRPPNGNGSGTTTIASQGHVKNLMAKIKAKAAELGQDEAALLAACLSEHKITTLDGITTETANAVGAWIKSAK